MDNAGNVRLYWEWDEQANPAAADKYGSYCSAVAGNVLDDHKNVEECVNDTNWQAWNATPPHRLGWLSVFLGKFVQTTSLNRYQYNAAEKQGGGTAPVVLDEIAEPVSDTGGVSKKNFQANTPITGAAVYQFGDDM